MKNFVELENIEFDITASDRQLFSYSGRFNLLNVLHSFELAAKQTAVMQLLHMDNLRTLLRF